MQKIIATIIFVLIITNIVTADKGVTAQLNNIYTDYAQGNFIAAEQNLLNLIANSNLKTQYTYMVELGDLYLDKLNALTKAESTYNRIIDLYPKEKNLADIYYRLGITYEKQENFLKAAQMYEIVATKYRNAQYAGDALDAIERCFKKNYQDIVAKINNYPITRIEFDDRMAMAPGLYETFESKQQLLTEMINDRLMYQEGLKRGFDQTQDFQERISDIRKNTMFQTWYEREVVKKIQITDAQKKKYYAKNKNEFVIPEQASAREILVLTKPEADSLYQVVSASPALFESLAQVRSLSPTKSNGGDMGLFRRGTHPEEIENALFKAKPNTILTPIYSEAKGGYVLLKLEDLKPRKVRNYNETAPEIENRMRAQSIEQTFKTKTDGFRNACQTTIIEDAFNQNLDTVARIDNEIISQQHINDYLSKIPPFYRSDFETPEGKRRILDQIILEKTWLRQLEKEKYWLLNSVFSSLEQNIKGNLINSIRKTEVTDKVFLTDDDIMKVYKKNIDEYKVPKQFRVREISVSTESVASAIRKLAVTSKMPFDSLARELSNSPTKRMGGDMGFFPLGTKSKIIEETVLKLKTGQISQVIKQNDSTYTILKLEEIKPASTKTFDEVKPTLQRKLRTEREQQRFTTFINEIKNNYVIEQLLVDEKPVPLPNLEDK